MLRIAALVGTTLLVTGIGIAEAGPGYRGGGHRGHHHHHYRPYYGRVVIGAPFLYSYPRYYYPAPAYYAPAPAPVYIEQQPAPVAAPAPQGDWFYCGPARAYYPDVPTCAEEWQRVAPR